MALKIWTIQEHALPVKPLRGRKAVSRDRNPVFWRLHIDHEFNVWKIREGDASEPVKVGHLAINPKSGAVKLQHEK